MTKGGARQKENGIASLQRKGKPLEEELEAFGRRDSLMVAPKASDLTQSVEGVRGESPKSFRCDRKEGNPSAGAFRIVFVQFGLLASLSCLSTSRRRIVNK
jgi:hypothetical protein